jgi:predicted nucleotidyltransferase component of viral defense system
MKVDTIYPARLTKPLEVIPNTLEKVILLTEILRFINMDFFLVKKLALKGGTAINLFFTNLPRLSVDIGFYYAINKPKRTC